MGRKPLTKQYFGPPQEEAVRVFLTATTWDEKNKVYNMTSGDEVGLVQLNNIGSQFIRGINNNIVFNNLRMYPGIMASGESTSNYIIWGGYPGQGHITFDGITLFSSSGMNGNMGIINPLIIMALI